MNTAHPEQDLASALEVMMLNIEDLDFIELERRLELADASPDEVCGLRYERV